MNKSMFIKITMAILVLVLLAGTFWMDHLMVLMGCQDTILQQDYSSDKKYLAQYCDVGCNTTVGFVQKVQLIDTQDPFREFKYLFKAILPGFYEHFLGSEGVVFVIEGQDKINLDWRNKGALMISYPISNRVFQKATQWKGVSIQYNQRKSK